MENSRRKQIVSWIVISICFLPALELTMRILGYRPYQQVPYTISSSPAFCLSSHPQLGFGLIPGEFKVCINEGSCYTATHGEDSLRITSLSPPIDSLPTIFLMGCSYTYGMGVDDTMTFAFRMEKALPQFHFKNMGVPGFGDIQALLQLRAAIARGDTPSMAMVCYADFHNMRNVLSPFYRRALFAGYERANPQIRPLMQKSRMPYIDESGIVRWEEWTNIYHHWRGRESSAVINALQTIDDAIGVNLQQEEELTVQLFQEIDRLCQANSIPLVVAGLTRTEATRNMLERLSEEGIQVTDISLDLTDRRYNQLPYDSHPNAWAHRHFADRLVRYITSAGIIPEEL